MTKNVRRDEDHFPGSFPGCDPFVAVAITILKKSGTAEDKEAMLGWSRFRHLCCYSQSTLLLFEVKLQHWIEPIGPPPPYHQALYPPLLFPF